MALELEPTTVLDVGTGSAQWRWRSPTSFRARGHRDGHLDGGAGRWPARTPSDWGSMGGSASSAGPFPRAGGFDLVVANLPYVREAEWESLAPEITRYEPREALVGGADGARGDRSPVPATVAALEPGASLALEVGAGQAGPVAELLLASVSARSRGRQDLAGIRPGGPRQPVIPTVSIADDGGGRARQALEGCVAQGGVAIFPADTLYGLGCDPSSGAAIERIHSLKGRDQGKPSALMFFAPSRMRELLSILGPRTREALGALLPGAVTLVVAESPSASTPSPAAIIPNASGSGWWRDRSAAPAA